jgi:hypothetical protein
VNCVCAETVGAVYRPVELIVPPPAPWTTDHVTAVLGVPVTVAVNCTLPPDITVAVDGLTVTEMTGFTVTVAVPDRLGSAWLVARTVKKL